MRWQTGQAFTHLAPSSITDRCRSPSYVSREAHLANDGKARDTRPSSYSLDTSFLNFSALVHTQLRRRSSRVRCRDARTTVRGPAAAAALSCRMIEKVIPGQQASWVGLGGEQSEWRRAADNRIHDRSLQISKTSIIVTSFASCPEQVNPELS
jgi:hypothetical protein